MTECMNATELHMNDTVSTVDETVSHVDSLDLKHGLSSEEVHKRALAARKLYGKAEKSLTFWIVEMDERKLYRDFGCSNVFQYATRYLNLGEHTIAEILRTGKALSQLPLLSEAFEKGQISSSHVREISRVATKNTEEYWCDTARGKTVREVEKLVAFTPKGGLPGMKSTALKPVNITVIQPEHSMTPAIPVESAILPAQIPAPAPASAPAQTSAPASAYVLKCTGAAETLQKESAVSEMTIQHQGSVKYHEKLVVDLDAEEMSVLKDAFTKAQKESGKRDRASLLLHIAKAFLEGCPPSGGRRKPRYHIVLHRHLPSGLVWCDTPKGERPVSPEVLEKALCDAEIVELDEPENPTGDLTGSPAVAPTGPPKVAPTGDQSIEKEHNTGITSVAVDRKEADIQKEASEYVNEQYMRIKAAKREGHKPCQHSKICQYTQHSQHSKICQYTQHSQHSQHSKISYKSLKKEGRAIPAALRKKVLLRDGCACQAPGCGRKIFLTIHHLTAFALCGIHNISLLLTLCAGCHTLVHEGKLSVDGEAPHRLIWRDRNGRVI